MKTAARLIALALFAVALAPSVRPAWAQDDNDTIAAAKKAATFIEMTGFAQVKPTQFFLSIEFEAEGKGQNAAQASLQDITQRAKATLSDRNFQIKNEQGTRVFFHPKDNPSAWAFVQGTMPASFSPDEPIKAMGSFGVLTNSPQKAQEAFALVRAMGAAGRVTVYNGLQNDEPARQAALKVAVEQANARAKILNTASAPKQLDLLFIKQGDFDVSETESRADLQGTKPLPLLDTINAKTSVVLFYGFKSPAAVASVATAATKAMAKVAGSKPTKPAP